MIGKKFYTTGLMAALAFGMMASTSALCPGETPCSGHGTCGANDKCSCFAGYDLEPDCSTRRCPSATSWGSPSSGLHTLSECADRGTCDRETSLCECFEGFEGAACQRLTCVDNCNGHGTCKTLSELSSGTYTGWDKDMIQACDCDHGYDGLTCADRKCRVGDDPITTGTVPEIQRLRPYGDSEDDSDAAARTLGTFLLTFTDWRGEVFKTRPIDIDTFTTTTIKEALEALPNNVIPSVTVTNEVARSTTSGADPEWRITFDSAFNSGDLPLLGFESAGCTTSGCQPAYAGLFDDTDTTPVAAVGTTIPFIAEHQAGTKENVACSNRGTCNAETGLCNCYPGFTGEVCGTQTVMT